MFTRSTSMLALTCILPVLGFAQDSARGGASPSDAFAHLRDALERAQVGTSHAGGGLLAFSTPQDGRTFLRIAPASSDSENAGPHLEPDTIFPVGAVAHPMLCIAATRLAEAGALELDAPLSTYLPEFERLWVEGVPAWFKVEPRPPIRSVLVRDLLTHTSGLSSPMFDSALFRSTHDGRSGELSVREWTKRVAWTSLAGDPGTVWNSSIAPDVLGAVLETATGLGLGELLEQHVFDPLEMRDTGFFVPESKRSRLLPGRVLEGWGRRRITPRSVPDAPPEHVFGGVGIYSTASDLLKLGEALLSTAGSRSLGSAFEPAGVAYQRWTPEEPEVRYSRWGWKLSAGSAANRTASLVDATHGVSLTIDVGRGAVCVLFLNAIDGYRGGAAELHARVVDTLASMR